MAMISVSDLKPEMVLAGDVLNMDGRFLLATRTVLSPKHVRILKMWGVMEVEIEGLDSEEVENEFPDHLSAESIAAAEVEIVHRFCRMDSTHPAVISLFRACAFRKAARLRDAWGPKKSEAPSKTGTVNSSIEPRAHGRRRHMDPHKLIEDGIDLPTLPVIYDQLNEIIKNPTSSAMDIGEVVEKDTSLSARLLKMVNSAFYGFPSKIDTLSRAITVVGIKQLSTLALGMTIINSFKKIPSDLMDMRRFWEHSIACGVCAKIIASYKNIPNSERLFVAGLLHDIGRLVLFCRAPHVAKRVLSETRSEDLLCHEAEIREIGFDHGLLGGLLLKKWRLPLSLETCVRHHHAPGKAMDPLDPSIVHLADIVVNALEYGTSGSRILPNLDPNAWQCIGISPNVLTGSIKQLDCQLKEIRRYFNVDEKEQDAAPQLTSIP